MFTQLFAGIRAASIRLNKARIRRSIALLRVQQRSERQERKARQIESRLFFDADLLATARSDREIGLSTLRRSMLACGMGILLFTSSNPGQASEGTDPTEPATAVEESGAQPSSSIAELIEEWLEDEFDLMDNPEDDPKEGTQ